MEAAKGTSVTKSSVTFPYIFQFLEVIFALFLDVQSVFNYFLMFDNNSLTLTPLFFVDLLIVWHKFPIKRMESQCTLLSNVTLCFHGYYMLRTDLHQTLQLDYKIPGFW